MITQDQYNYLMQLEKYIIENENVLEIKNYSPVFPISDRIYMISKDDNEFNFFLEIFQSSKKNTKLTLHFQENETSIGLMRVDFNARHINPVDVNSYVPDNFAPYAGSLIGESHIHYFVSGYKPLAWAIPLKIDESFPVKDFFLDNNFDDILNAFNIKINLITKMIINIQTQLQ